jgi:hypothetical protein
MGRDKKGGKEGAGGVGSQLQVASDVGKRSTAETTMAEKGQELVVGAGGGDLARGAGRRGADHDRGEGSRAGGDGPKPSRGAGEGRGREEGARGKNGGGGRGSGAWEARLDRSGVPGGWRRCPTRPSGLRTSTTRGRDAPTGSISASSWGSWGLGGLRSFVSSPARTCSLGGRT